jgi:IstB-like ATP binding protein
MLDSATIDGLKALRLDAMAAALAEQHEQASYTGLGFDERLGLLVDRELTARASRRMDRCLKAARLRARPPSRTSTSATPAAWTAPRSSASPRPTGWRTTAPW